MAASKPLLAKDLDVNSVTFSNVKSLDNGGKLVFVSHNKQQLVLQTPEMAVPFGISRFNESNKYTLDLSFRGMDQRESVKAFFERLQDLDRRMVDAGMENSWEWFKKKLTVREVCEALYSNQLRYGKSKDGEVETKFPPTFRLNLPFKDGRFAVDAYDATSKTKVDVNELGDLKGAKVAAIIACTGVWLVSLTGTAPFCWYHSPKP